MRSGDAHVVKAGDSPISFVRDLSTQYIFVALKALMLCGFNHDSRLPRAAWCPLSRAFCDFFTHNGPPRCLFMHVTPKAYVVDPVSIPLRLSHGGRHFHLPKLLFPTTKTDGDAKNAAQTARQT